MGESENAANWKAFCFAPATILRGNMKSRTNDAARGDAHRHKTSARGCIALPNGRELDFDIRLSPRNKSVRLKVSATDGLVVIAPEEMPVHRVVELVAGKAGWIAARLVQLDEARRLLSVAVPVRPQAFDLPALGESWRVEYRVTPSTKVAARSERPGQIVVLGAVDNASACQAALRRWLARHAKTTLVPWLSRVAQATGLNFTGVTLKNQRTRWGSCTRRGRISLNCKLLFLPPELVRHVLVHELCHTRELNHSKRFWALVHKFEPDADAVRRSMRDAWKYLPCWA